VGENVLSPKMCAQKVTKLISSKKKQNSKKKKQLEPSFAFVFGRLGGRGGA
jgi:hypothetical protein